MQFKDFNCDICGSSEGKKIDFSFFFFPTNSTFDTLHEFDNYICEGCGVVFSYPQMEEKKLVNYYNTSYRESSFALHIDEKLIDVPLKIPGSGVSLQRVKTFYETIMSNSMKIIGITPNESDVFIDYGAYQGMFLYGVSSIWNCECIAYDYNEKGIGFAKKLFGFTDSVVGKDICSDVFEKRAKYVSLIHSFEHLKKPSKFLKHVKRNIIEENGFLYIQVPNVYASHLSHPTHCYSYSVETLSKVLKLNGFEVLDVRTTGYPPSIHNYLAHNDDIDIICLCRSINSGKVVEIDKCDTLKIYKKLKTNYRRLSVFALINQFKIVVRQVSKFIYYFLNILIENVFGRFAIKILMPIRGYKKYLKQSAED